MYDKYAKYNEKPQMFKIVDISKCGGAVGLREFEVWWLVSRVDVLKT